LLAAPGAGVAPLPVDVAFPLIHGWGGEDGRLQGALELAGIPYAGSDVLGSAVGMDKAVAKRVLAAHGIPQVPWLEFTRAAYVAEPAAALRRVESELELPVFVKPANGGSSVGITRVTAADGLAAAFDEALAHDRKVVVERGVDAREIECAVLGNDRPEASGLGEIVPSGDFYDYAAKYVDDRSELKIPAPLDSATADALRGTALAAYRALGLCGFARVDFLLERNSGGFWLNEVNSLPGFTPISVFPKLWEAAGLSYPKLVERLVELALERSADEQKRQTKLER
jgi:D-alanine-D-alanine ligase